MKLATEQKKQLADLAKVSTRTIENWVNSKPELIKVILKHFKEKTLTDRIIEVGQKPYSSLSSLELEMLSIENENGYFIDETLYENRKLIGEIRKKWWEEG